jgi:SagB-type dehydrogenase family enzyme
MPHRRLFLLVSFLSSSFVVAAQGLEPVTLPKPQTEGGRPLMQVLNERKSGREFSARPLPLQVLSNLLWAGFGINRQDGRRTAPSSSNRQELELYVVLPEGAYLWDAKQNRLQPVASGDLRAATGSASQTFVATAAVNLVYVADYSKMGGQSDQNKAVTAAADSGFISQNVYLFCASEGLATVVRGGIDRAAIEKALKLRPEQHVTYAQSIGYPKGN